MKVYFNIKRYGSIEERTIDIDVEQQIKDEMKNTIFSLAGFEPDAEETIEVDYTKTAKGLL